MFVSHIYRALNNLDFDLPLLELCIQIKLYLVQERVHWWAQHWSAFQENKMHCVKSAPEVNINDFNLRQRLRRRKSHIKISV